MDFIWVPDSGAGKTGLSAGMSSSNEFTLFLCGFVILAASAAAGSLLMGGEVAKLADKFGMRWVVDLVSYLPWLGYLFATTGALIGAAKSSASVKRRLLWFIGTQAVAATLWFSSTLH